MQEFVVAPDHPCLPGHFPGQPVVPGVVVLDHVASAIEAAYGPLGAVSLPQVKFMQPLLPGQTACIDLVPVEGEGDVARWRFRVLRGDTLLASGEMRAAAADAFAA